MTTRQQLCQVLIPLPLCLAVLVLSARPAGATFVPFDLGNWQYEAPAGTTITETPGRVTKTFGLTLTTTFTDLNEKVITFRTTPGHDEDERFFMFDMNISNGLPAGSDFVGFIIKTLDQIDPLPHTPGPAHPIWAHIHPAHSSPNAGAATPTGPNYAQFPLLDQNVTNGIEVLTVSGGTVTSGNSWMPQRVRLHDKNALGDMFVSSDTISFDQIGQMEFKLVLQPLVVPEPSTLALVGSGLAGLAALRLRRPAKPGTDGERGEDS